MSIVKCYYCIPMKYANIILFKKAGDFDQELTYRISEELSGHLKEGFLVEAPFRSKIARGIVTALNDQIPSGITEDKIKPIKKIISEKGLLPHHLTIARFVARYYQTTLGRALRLLIPKALWDGKGQEPGRIFIRLLQNESKEVRGSKAKKILQTLKECGGEIPIEGLKEKVGGFTSATFKKLIELAQIEKIHETAYSAFDPKTVALIEPDKNLTPAQNQGLGEIRASDKPVLVHGVTGSGKTEVYLRLILECAKGGKQSILLVPEIALTPQMISAFAHYFGDRIALFHSKLSDGERAREWWKVRSGYAPLTIGSRSAIFAPVINLGLIILDEEHEWTYKQESAPYYRTHQIAEAMAKLWNARLILGSATPSAESYHKAKAGEYHYFSLPERVSQNEMPVISVVDLRDEFKKRNFSVFSLLLQNKIRDRLEKKEQIILFVNQRGLANAVVCRDCGYTEKCPRCEIALKYHRNYKRSAISNQLRDIPLIADSRSPNSDLLVCHYCQFTKPPSLLCPNCRSPYIKHMGVGTQKVEEEVRRMFPCARVVRADRDTTDNKDGFEPIYHDFVDHKYDILIGTQMVAKGLDFGSVSLIGIVLADIGLNQPDFRSSERLFQILTQVAGRCGRRDKPGEVVLQTYNPDHPTIKRVAQYDYLDFIENDLNGRKAFGYPPFGRMVKFTVVGTDLSHLSKHIEAERQTLEDVSKLHDLNLKILSAPASIPKIADRYYYHILIRSEKPETLFEYWKLPKGWRIDVDPVHTT